MDEIEFGLLRMEEAEALVALAAVVCGFFVKDTPRGTRSAPTEVSLH